MRRIGVFLAAVVLAGVAACGDDSGTDGAEGAERGASSVRLDQVQLLATHNSYHLEAPAPVRDALASASSVRGPRITRTTHRSWCSSR